MKACLHCNRNPGFRSLNDGLNYGDARKYLLNAPHLDCYLSFVGLTDA